MNPRERVLTALRRGQPDRVPFALSLTPPMMALFREQTGADDPAEYWDFDIRWVGFHDPDEPADYMVYYPESLPEGTYLDVWGIANVPGSMYHFTKMVPPLGAVDSVDALAAYPLPDFTRPECWQHLAPQVAAYHQRGRAAAGALEMTIFEVSWYLRGMENLFSDMLLQPEWAAVLLDRVTALRVFQAETYARANVDVLALGDDIAMQTGMLMSPRMWRRWFKPRLAQVIAAARAIKPEIVIHYHTDGDCQQVIPELIEVGIDVLNPVQPECMDPARLKQQYGHQIAFSGTVGTQSTMPYGTPADVAAVVQERVATVGKGGGLMLMPTHVLEPDVPWENVVAFVEAVRTLGIYG